MVRPEHPPEAGPCPLTRVPRLDRLPVELEALEAANESGRESPGAGGGVGGGGGQEQSAVGAHHAAGLGGVGGGVLVVQGQPRAGGVDHQLQVVPAAVRHRHRPQDQGTRQAAATAVLELQLPVGQLWEDSRRRQGEFLLVNQSTPALGTAQREPDLKDSTFFVPLKLITFQLKIIEWTECEQITHVHVRVPVRVCRCLWGP